MSFRDLRHVVAAGAILSGVLLVQALPVEAVTTGPTVIAVHRDGAIDVPGGTFGTIAKMSVPAGNWSITATATLVGTDTTYGNECQLVAGTDSYTTGTDPSAQGGGSSQAVVLLLAHHFAKTGTVTLKCSNSGWAGDVLIRDVHVVAVQVAQLYTGDVTYGTGSPQAIYAQDTSFRQYLDTAQYGVQDLSLPAGTWLVHATLWAGAGSVNSPRVNCFLVSGNTAQDQSFASVPFYRRTISLEGVFRLAFPGDVYILCNVSTGGWIVYSSAESAIKVGTLKYGQLGGNLSTTGSGSPNVIGGYGGPGGITDATSPASIGSLSLGAGSWFVSSKLSVQGGGNTPKVTCQLRVSTGASQSRVVLDGADNLYNWMAMSLTRKLTATANASDVCNQSAGTLGAGFFNLKIFALKAGTLTDTAL
jgi:hypothetical protein